VKDLLNDQKFTGLARDIYNHALINPRSDGTAEKEPKILPAYIDPKQFADALLDVSNIKKGTTDELEPFKEKADQQQLINGQELKTELTKLVEESPGDVGALRNEISAWFDQQLKLKYNQQLRKLLIGIIERSPGDLGAIRKQISDWFDNAMDRVSGVYKRRTQIWSFVLAFLVAAALNVSTIEIARELWLRPTLAHTLAPQVGFTAKQALDQMSELGLPVGWTQERLKSLGSIEGAKVALKDFGSIKGLELAVGWLLTALATLFGAPFWFDALQQIVRLKGSGPSPAEKSSGAGAAA
jgi:hypothetical protein